MIAFDFWVPGEPIQQGSLRSFISKSTHRLVTIHDKPELKSWRNLVALRCRDVMHTKGIAMAGKETAVGLQIRFFLYRCKAAAKRAWPVVEVDCDKLARSINDALSNVAYVDDKQVCRIEAEKTYEQALGPGAEIRVIWLDALL